MQATSRLEQFAVDVAALRVSRGDSDRCTVGIRVGVALLLIGIGIGVGAYLVSRSTTDPLTQRDSLVAAVAGTSVTIAGSAVYLRYGLARFLRFWLARLIYENTARAAPQHRDGSAVEET